MVASASHKRIMYTHWCGDAYEKLITEKNHNINQAYIDKGMTLAADGSEVRTCNVDMCDKVMLIKSG